MDILLKNAVVVTPNEAMKRNILIKGGVISKVSGTDEADMEYEVNGKIRVIDAENNFVSAGFIDLHSHLRDPGYTYKEDIESGTRAAVKGGFTTVLCMPNTNPCIDNANGVKYIYDAAQKSGYCNVLPVGAVTVSQKGEMLTDFSELKRAGAIAISDDGRPVENAVIMREALLRAKEEDILIISHCEDLSLAQITTGTGNPNSAEDVITARDIILAGETGAKIHIAHVSSEKSVDFVEWAKKKGYRVTAETCPHYFSLTDRDAAKIGVNAKMNPPLRSERDRDRVIDGIVNGVIDCISTDHAPHSADDKCEDKNDFAKAANGIIGFETAFAAGVTYLVRTGIIGLNRLIELMTVNPAKIIGIHRTRGQIKEGFTADIVVFNTDEKYIYDGSNSYSKSRNTPYNGFEFYGKILHTIVNGVEATRFL